MNLSTALAVDLQRLTSVLDGSPRPDAALTESLRLLGADALAAVRSYLGLSVTLTVDGQDVTLTSLTETVEPDRIGSTLRVPLGAIGAGRGTVVFYASHPNAFVALAADLRRAARASVDPALSGAAEADEIRLEVWDPATPPDVADPAGPHRPTPLVSGVTGAVEMSSVNRAVGLLMGRGFLPDEARLLLLEQAASENRPVHQVAERWLSTTAEPVAPDRQTPPHPEGVAG